MKSTIESIVINAVLRLQEKSSWRGFVMPEIQIDRPKDSAHGDWMTNVAFVIAKELQKSPVAVAEELAGEINAVANEAVARAEAVAPGFVNFILHRNALVNMVRQIMTDKDSYGKNTTLVGQKVMVEYTQPNPFKPFHIGHLMSNTIGESLAHIMSFCGATVVRANYQGDVGPHVAKSLWAIQKFEYDINNIDEIGKAYAKGHEAYESDVKAKEEIQAINKAIYMCSDEALMKLYVIGRQKTLERFEEIYAILGTKFDVYYFESETWKKGAQIVHDHMGDIFEESDGAIIFDAEKYGLHKRVFITAQGLPTYEAKDVGLAMLKKETHPSDVYFTTTAVEQDEYFKVVKKAIELVDASFEGKIYHISHGMMQLSTGKMSSRKGNVITGESLIVDAQKVARKKMSERAIDDKREETVNAIAVAGIKFSILKQHIGKNVVYDAGTALSFDGDSGPYVQYTYARCRSVIAKAQEKNIIPSLVDVCDASIVLERLLTQFPDVVARANAEHAPHHIATHLIKCAHEFNAYYAKKIFIDAKDHRQSAYRIALAQTVAQVLKNGLTLLGISAPEKM
jgi:arginyl-tRNA synthetase